MAEDLTDAIVENAEGPESASADGVQVKRRSLRDLIDADRYLAEKAAAQSPVAALTRIKIVPPGTV